MAGTAAYKSLETETRDDSDDAPITVNTLRSARKPSVVYLPARKCPVLCTALYATPETIPCMYVNWLQEDDLEAVYEDPPPKLTAARTAVCAAAVVVGAIACLFVVALVFHHGMNVDDGAEKVGAGLFLV